jgi:hypothetical protein
MKLHDMRFLATMGTLLLATTISPSQAQDWKPVSGKIMTRWAAKVDPAKTLPEYPRPQMRRSKWQSLNGLWDYAIRPKAEDKPAKWDGKILVPFCVESALSGVGKMVGEDNALWYRQTVDVPKTWKGQSLLLHFGAVDWETKVWVNGKLAGSHTGGYDPFTLDITDYLNFNGPQEIVIRVWDPSDASTQPRGKQVRKPESIWYTPVTGLWQTVWIEPVSPIHMANVKLTPDVDRNCLWIEPQISGDPSGLSVTATATVICDSPSGKVEVPASVHGAAGQKLCLTFVGGSPVRLWTPDSPTLHDLKVVLEEKGKTLDSVDSYFGMRKISVGRDDKGFQRILLNDKPLFQYGPLDQGFWPDGIYTAPTDEALRYDIEMTKKMGFNMARKHVKVEPDRWYYWCDKLGLIVWQDMPSGDRYIGPNEPDIKRTAESDANYLSELTRMMNALHSHPSIVMWVPFNEGWGQYDTAKVAKMVKEYDPSRLVNSVSGWADRGVGDMHDIHVYPGPASPKPESVRAVVLGEFGGLGLPLKGHTWQDAANWGYRSFTTPESLTEAYLGLMTALRPLIGSHGLSAAVYTQTTDVEIEVNGLMTYDRAILKMPLEKLAEAHRKLYLAPPVVTELLPTAQKTRREWSYTTEKPVDGWFKPEFSVSGWKTGQSGFGTAGTPGAIIGTEWNTPDIWARTTFNLGSAAEGSDLLLSIHHDEDAEVYINGLLAAKVNGYISDYALIPVSAAARKALKPGNNVIAVHCHQTGGGQYIDVGLVALREAK